MTKDSCDHASVPMIAAGARGRVSYDADCGAREHQSMRRAPVQVFV